MHNEARGGRAGAGKRRAPAPLLPAWRVRPGRAGTAFGRGTSPEELAQVASQAPAAMREAEAQNEYLRGAYRDPDQAADALDADRAIRPRPSRSGADLAGGRARSCWAPCAAGRDYLPAVPPRTIGRAPGPAAAAIVGSLDREAAARDAAVRHHTGEVEQQRARDAVEVPGLSLAALATPKAVQMAGLTAEIPRKGERYDARQRRREELVSAAWREGRPRSARG